MVLMAKVLFWMCVLVMLLAPFLIGQPRKPMTAGDYVLGLIEKTCFCWVLGHVAGYW